MCGFTGFIGQNNPTILTEMNNRIIHRGPDAGESIILKDKVHFAHRRLSILDLSETGRQPMTSHDGKWTIIFNGEIYNFPQLKSELKRNWRGTSDTEILLEAFSEWGVEATLKKATGMFGFALLHHTENVLYLGRDRFGEKPVYYGELNGTFFFGSELKSFKPHPDFNPKISRSSLKSYFKYNYVPAPQSIYESIFKLKPGHYLEVKVDNLQFRETCYWDLKVQQPFKGSFQEASGELEKKLLSAVKMQMVSDVPLGAFLSGGVDSSLVVALMQAQSARPVKTFTIGFHEENFNEAGYAKEVAAHLKTDHTEFYVKPQDALDLIPKLPEIYDEPFADVSQIPTYLLAKLTRQHVTVSLSGDAGDEVFGGYGRYFMAAKAHQALKLAPRAAKSLLASGMTKIPPGVWDKIAPVRGDKIHKLAQLVDTKNKKDIYLKLISFWQDEENPVLGSDKPSAYNFNSNLGSFQEKMMFLDTKTYLPDDILVKVDRAGMKVSLESRVPFLDPSVVEYAWSLPLDYKIHKGEGKKILKDVLYRYVPKELIDRPKKGFGTPVDSWLRNELKDWALSLLQESRINQQGYLNYNIIKKKWDEHQSGVRNWQAQLWSVLMFQLWLENNHD